MGLWLVLLSEKPSSTSRVVGQQIAKMVFKLFNFYSYIIFGVGERDGGGGGVVKIIKRFKRGSWTNFALANRGTLHNNFSFEADVSASPPDNYYTVPKG